MIAAFQVEVVGDGVEIWPVLGTFATFFAVLVALFGSAFWEWVRRPTLALSEASDLVSMLGSGNDPKSVPAFVLNVENNGKQQANDVQVFLSVDTPSMLSDEPDIRKVVAFQVPVPFFHQEGGGWNKQFSVAIPPGFSRPIRIATKADAGVVLAHDAEKPRNALDEDVYKVFLDVVGSNFRVARFQCALKVEADPTSYMGRLVQAVEAPKKIRYQSASPFG